MSRDATAPPSKARETDGRTATRSTARIATAVAAWSGWWLLPWQQLLSSHPGLRSAIALALFCLPGYCLYALVVPGAPRSVARRAPAALLLSTALTGALGFCGGLLRLPTGVVAITLWGVGAAGLARLVHDADSRSSLDRGPCDRQRSLDGLLLLVVVLTAARLCVSPVMGADDMTYVARMTWFQQTPTLSFSGIIFGGDLQISPRDWLAFWPLCEAIIANLADVDGLRLTTLYLGPLLAPLAVLSVYGLARALGMSRRAGVTSAALQLAALLLLVTRDQPGRHFFQRLVEDKFLALYVFGPVVLQLAIAVLDDRQTRRLVALALGWLGITFVHPTALGIVFLVLCAFAGLELVVTRSRAALVVLAVVVPMTVAAASVRFLPSETQHPAYFDVTEAAQANAMSGARERRVDVVAGTRFYGIGASSAPPLARAVGALVLLVALLDVRRARAARFVVAATMVAACAIFPYTGWLLGKLLTPFHLWRILAAVPYGIGLVLVAEAGARRLRDATGRSPVESRATALAPIVAIVVLLATVAFAAGRPRALRIAALGLAPDWSERLDARVKFDRNRPRFAFTDLDALARALDGAVDDRAVVLGDPEVNSLIPSLSSKARLVVFRSPAQTAQHSGMPTAQAKKEWRHYQRLTLGQLSPDEALSYLSRHDVRFVVTATEPGWLAAIPADRLTRRALARAGPLTLYAISGPPRTADPGDEASRAGASDRAPQGENL